LGNLEAKRDWGHAKDYIEAMWLMLQQEEPDDFVIATGVATSVRDFVKMAFAHAGVSIEFEGKAELEKGVVVNVSIPDIPVRKGDVVVEVDSRYFRPTEVDLLQGDASKAKQKLGWSPKHSVHDLAKEMVEADIENFRKEVILKDSGYRTIRQFE
jgi:GDPmannose 4,6-dehydratase